MKSTYPYEVEITVICPHCNGRGFYTDIRNNEIVNCYECEREFRIIYENIDIGSGTQAEEDGMDAS
jgi:DNA-directed RNA polymerase subunit RPC12/RpoP